MKYVGEVEDRDGLKAIVVQDLKENGIKVPKVKKQTSKSNLTVSTCRRLACCRSLAQPLCFMIPSEIIRWSTTTPTTIPTTIRTRSLRLNNNLRYTYLSTGTRRALHYKFELFVLCLFSTTQSTVL